MPTKFVSTFYEVHKKITASCKMQPKHVFYEVFPAIFLHSYILSALLNTQGAGPIDVEIFNFIYFLYTVVLPH